MYSVAIYYWINDDRINLPRPIFLRFLDFSTVIATRFEPGLLLTNNHQWCKVTSGCGYSRFTSVLFWTLEFMRGGSGFDFARPFILSWRHRSRLALVTNASRDVEACQFWVAFQEVALQFFGKTKMNEANATSWWRWDDKTTTTSQQLLSAHCISFQITSL